MAQQRITWTSLPANRVERGRLAGRLRVSIVVSPRLTPQAANEQVLAAFPEWLDWPATLSRAKFALRIGAQAVPLTRISTSDSALWTRLFTSATPVAGFVFQD